MAAKDKDRYKEEMANYSGPSDNDDDSDDESKGKKVKKKKPKKDPNAPKRAMTAFMYFSNAMRAKIKEDNPDFSFGEIGKMVGQKYRELSSMERAEYDAKAAQDKIRYKNEMANYKSKEADKATIDSSDE